MHIKRSLLQRETHSLVRHLLLPDDPSGQRQTFTLTFTPGEMQKQQIQLLKEREKTHGDWDGAEVFSPSVKDDESSVVTLLPSVGEVDLDTHTHTLFSLECSRPASTVGCAHLRPSCHPNPPPA